jgi:hypothetical protein
MIHLHQLLHRQPLALLQQLVAAHVQIAHAHLAALHVHARVQLGQPFVQPERVVAARVAQQQVDILVNRYLVNLSPQTLHGNGVPVQARLIEGRRRFAGAEALPLLCRVEGDELDLLMQLGFESQCPHEEVTHFFEVLYSGSRFAGAARSEEFEIVRRRHGPLHRARTIG